MSASSSNSNRASDNVSINGDGETPRRRPRRSSAPPGKTISVHLKHGVSIEYNGQKIFPEIIVDIAREVQYKV